MRGAAKLVVLSADDCLLAAGGQLLRGEKPVSRSNRDRVRRRPPDHRRRQRADRELRLRRSRTTGSPRSAAAARCTVPAGAAHVDLTGKTVMPTHGRSARPYRLPEHRRRHDVEGDLHAREPDRSSAAPRLSRRRRGGEHRRPGRPLRHARRPHRLGRRAAAGARRGHAGRGAVPHRRRRHGVAGRGRAGPPCRGST